MIFEALNCVTEEMNNYFNARLKLSEDKVSLSAIVNQDGTLAINGENKLVITLINIENDTTAKSVELGVSKGAGYNRAPQVINLYMLVSAYFNSSNYAEALRFISFAIAFFQDKSVFTHQNTPGLDSQIDKLMFEIENASFDKMSNLWSSLGAKYMPSIIYKVRMLTFNSSIIKEYRPVITGIEPNSK